MKIYPDKSVVIVEIEKSTIITSSIFPDIIWLAARNLNGLSIEKCLVLKERDVTLYPDLGDFEKWNIKAVKIKQFLKYKMKNTFVLFLMDVLFCKLIDFHNFKVVLRLH